jgi:hypothetical protein
VRVEVIRIAVKKAGAEEEAGIGIIEVARIKRIVIIVWSVSSAVAV